VDGKSLAVRKDVMGFMVVDPPAGEHTVRMEFGMPLENKAGWVLTVLTLIALALLLRSARPAAPPSPSAR
jgi:uncharacterized membrane protein YfhO